MLVINKSIAKNKVPLPGLPTWNPTWETLVNFLVCINICHSKHNIIMMDAIYYARILGLFH